jgi:succinate-semialdehyde dehydrogenase/glutarate-semialdehyde dehydrogenase
LCDGIAAIAAGNAVVAKPDAQTMLSALLGAEILEEAGLPKDLWTIVAGPGSRVGTSIIEKADYICFTGSTATGKRVAAGCAERLIGCSLELGGKNPMIVLADADIERAAEGAVRAVFSNTGQLCVSIERLYVADAIYDRFMARFRQRTEAMTLGAGTGWGIDMGTMISEDQVTNATRHVDDAVSKGARVVTGGKARPELAPYFFEPTILEGVTPDMEVFGNETFGPVVSVYRFSDEADVVARANEGEYGLNASIWSRDGARARRLAAQVKAGTVNINEAFAASFASLAAPMGGVRESGMGRRQGREGILRYTESQSVATQRVMPIAPVLGMSDETYAKVMTLSLKALKALGRA